MSINAAAMMLDAFKHTHGTAKSTTALRLI
jgi:hypothetical protein